MSNAEFGTTGGLRFIPSSQVKIYEAPDKEMLCACGKPAVEMIVGSNSYTARCSECMEKSFSE